jgi:hypothetical protein
MKSFPREVFDRPASGTREHDRAHRFGGNGWGALELALVTGELAWACTGIAGAFGLNTIFGDVFHP